MESAVHDHLLRQKQRKQTASPQISAFNYLAVANLQLLVKHRKSWSWAARLHRLGFLLQKQTSTFHLSQPSAWSQPVCWALIKTAVSCFSTLKKRVKTQTFHQRNRFRQRKHVNQQQEVVLVWSGGKKRNAVWRRAATMAAVRALGKKRHRPGFSGCQKCLGFHGKGSRGGAWRVCRVQLRKKPSSVCVCAMNPESGQRCGKGGIFLRLVHICRILSGLLFSAANEASKKVVRWTATALSPASTCL